MAVTLTATLLSGADPRPVQIALNGTTAGQAYRVFGSTADGSQWVIPGGTGVSAGSQVLLVDSQTALNAPITYQAVVAGVTYTAAPVTVTSADVAVLQTNDGLIRVGVEIASTTEPRKAASRSTVFDIAGRPDPAIRLDVPGSFEFQWMLETQGVDSATMQAILQTGRPVVRRTVPGLRDLDPVVIGVVLDWSDELITVGMDTWRRWNLRVREIPQPQPSTPLIAFTWADFDAAMASRVWSYHSTLASVAGLTATNGTLSAQGAGGYPDGGAAFGRLTVTTAAIAATVFETVYTAAAATLGTPVIPGMVVTAVLRVKGTAGRSVSAAIKWSGGTTSTGAAVTLKGAWQQVSVTATAPAGTTGLAYGVSLAAAGVLAGDLVDFDAVTLSQGATVPRGTFDELFSTWDQFDKADWKSLV